MIITDEDNERRQLLYTNGDSKLFIWIITGIFLLALCCTFAFSESAVYVVDANDDASTRTIPTIVEDEDDDSISKTMTNEDEL
eukprot:CAMPEP_0168167360 /NCGR_PEP_ID=MMETSP0139_2-20121125/2508_1 /TAXON_ID=44445 /ORGANISM="Pseudo-nitzschia australis, Strain 10249 10 AB" /LENGTH=82 /DNA_ID=CAMNT_0008084597 /DNA_START=591 /DNA_END=839 /DNA_ORIENTATION=+